MSARLGRLVGAAFERLGGTLFSCAGCRRIFFAWLGIAAVYQRPIIGNRGMRRPCYECGAFVEGQDYLA